MKYLKTIPAACTGAKACEKACSKAFFKQEDAVLSCIQHVQKGDKHELNVCNQCGECIDVCPVKAISRNKAGIVMVDKQSCVGCFMCIGFCPTMSMRRAPGKAVPFKCVSCGICAKACPSKALTIEERDHAERPH